MIALPKAKRHTTLELGELTLHAAPLLASGIVVDDAGNPVADAKLSVYVLPKSFGTGSYLTGGDPVLNGSTGVDGRFEMWGDAPDADLKLYVACNDPARQLRLVGGPNQDFVAAATDVRVVLWRCGEIRGRVLCDRTEIDDLSVSVKWKRADGNESEDSQRLEDDGTFQILVPASTSTLAILRRNAPIVRRETIEVKPGLVTELPSIDLAPPTNAVELTIVDELARPVPKGWIVLPNASEDPQFDEIRKTLHPQVATMIPRFPSFVLFQDGRATLRGERAPTRLAVGAKGRVAVMVRHPAANERVVLAPAPRVELVLDYDGAPIPAPYSLFVEFGPLLEDEEWLRFGPDAFSVADSLRLDPMGGIALRRGEPIALPIRCLG